MPAAHALRACEDAEQQGQLSVHRLRECYKAERTALINRIRGVLAEFGLVYPQSPEALRRVLAEVLEDAGALNDSFPPADAKRR